MKVRATLLILGTIIPTLGMAADGYVTCKAKGGTPEQCRQQMPPEQRAKAEKRQAAAERDAQRSREMVEKLKPHTLQ